LSEIISVQRSNTLENVQRKQALTPAEREQEEEEVINEEESEDEDEEVIYNPKNLPLGWDGKVLFKFLTLSDSFYLSASI
jgi:splicing factor 3A subunit 3